MGVAALVVGIVAMIFSLIPFIGALAVIPVIPGLLLAVAQIAWPKKAKGMAIAGLVLCLIAGVVSFLQYKATEKAGESVEELAEDLSAERKELEAKTGIILDDTPPSAGKKNRPEKVEPLKLNGVYKFRNHEARMIVTDFENLTGKTILVFRGYLVYYDDFGKIERREKMLFRNEIAPKGTIVIARLSSGRHTQEYTAKNIEELSTFLPVPFSHIRVAQQVNFECTDIKYAR